VDIYGTNGTPENLPAVPDITLPGIKSIPFVGDVIGQMNLMEWLGLLAVLGTWLVVFRTTAGLRLRSAGENPRAAETAGLSPAREVGACAQARVRTAWDAPGRAPGRARRAAPRGRVRRLGERRLEPRQAPRPDHAEGVAGAVGECEAEGLVAPGQRARGARDP